MLDAYRSVLSPFTRFTCLSETNSIVGGSGEYSGAQGHESFVFVDDDVIESELTFCQCCDC